MRWRIAGIAFVVCLGLISPLREPLDRLTGPVHIASAQRQQECIVRVGEFLEPCTPTPMSRPTFAPPSSATPTPPPPPTPVPTLTPTPEPRPTPAQLPTPTAVTVGAPGGAPALVRLSRTGPDCLQASVDASTFGGNQTLIGVYKIELPDISFPFARGYVRFDLSGIPSGATINSATLRMYLHEARYESITNLRVWRLIADWSPDALYTSPPPFDYPPAGASINSVPGWKSWTVTGLVAGWVRGDAPNYGVMISGNDVGGPGAYDYSREFRSREFGDGSYAPCLDLDYSVPAPAPAPGPNEPTYTPTRTPTKPPTWTLGPTWTPVSQPGTRFTLPAPYDFVPLEIDVVQATNSFSGNNNIAAVPAIARKDTLVRVWVDLRGSETLRDATVSLRAFRGNTELSPCTGSQPKTGAVQPDSVRPKVLAEFPLVLAELRWDFTRSFNFVLPPNCPWLDAGDVTLRARVAGHVGSYDTDLHPENDTIERAFHFYPSRPLRVKPYLFTYQLEGSPNYGAQATLSEAAKGFDFVRRMYPISQVELRPPTYLTVWYDFESKDSDDFGDALDDTLDAFKDGWGDSSVDTNLGLLPRALFAGAPWAGSGERPGYHAVVDVSDRAAYAHEMGHNLGLRHASNDHGESTGGDWEHWPYFHGELGGLGWDAARPNKLIPGLGEDYHSHDFMTYGDCAAAPGYNADRPTYCSDWISPRSYARVGSLLACSDPHTLDEDDIKDCMGGIAPFAPVPSGLAPPGPQAETGPLLMVAGSSRAGPDALQGAQPAEREYVLVSARITRDGAATLRPFYRQMLPAATAVRVGSGSYRIELRGADGSLLTSRNFEPMVRSIHGQTLGASIEELVPWDPATSRIVLLRSSQVLADRTVSPSPPRVAVVSPNGGEVWGDAGAVEISWRAEDPDGDQLFFWIEYSRDAGTTWETIQRNVQGTSYTLDLANVGGAARALVRVRATDGVNTLADVSDGFFTIARRPPVAAIIEPDEGSVFVSADTIEVRGLATDYDDGMLPGQALSWSSDIQGELGSGESVYARLTPGDHTLTLTATNSAGQQGSASVRVSVR